MTDWRPLGDRAIRVARPPNTSPRAILRAVRAWPGVVDVVIARDHVGVYFRGEPWIDPAALATLAALPDENEPAREIVLHATYDGMDLDEIARASGLATDEVIGVHAAATYLVEVMGFSPGFAYLTGLDPRLTRVPRRATPRMRVPAGSLAIAGGYCGVYPFDSPGGWNIIGRVDEPMFGPDGARLGLGDRVRFVR